jgi:hypothetical protein
MMGVGRTELTETVFHYFELHWRDYMSGTNELIAMVGLLCLNDS